MSYIMLDWWLLHFITVYHIFLTSFNTTVPVACHSLVKGNWIRQYLLLDWLIGPRWLSMRSLRSHAWFSLTRQKLDQFMNVTINYMMKWEHGQRVCTCNETSVVLYNCTDKPAMRTWHFKSYKWLPIIFEIQTNPEISSTCM